MKHYEVTNQPQMYLLIIYDIVCLLTNIWEILIRITRQNSGYYNNNNFLIFKIKYFIKKIMITPSKVSFKLILG